LDGKPDLFFHYLARFLHSTRILNAMARTRQDFGSSRFWLDKDLKFIPFEKMILTHSRLLVLEGEPDLFAHYLARFLYRVKILNVMVRSRRDLGSSRYELADDL
jgi:hypothetical protein